MDYSYLNTGLWNAVIQLGIIAAAIIVANILRRKVPFVKNSLMPVAVLAGFILLVLRNTGVLQIDSDFYEMLVYHSIALGFIAMSLRVTGGEQKKRDKFTGAKSGALIVGSYLIQAVCGLLISLLLAYTIMPGLFKAAGILLPMAYGQGPGQANNIGGTYEALGFAGGRSFGLSLAATGYLCACVVGVIVINVLAAKKKISKNAAGEISGSVTVDRFQDEGEIPLSESVDKFSIQCALVLIVYLVTYIVTRFITVMLSKYAPAAAGSVNTLLWGFNFIVGSAFAMLAKLIMKRLKKVKIMTRQYQNNYLLSRISGFFFDIMIVAGVASIDIADLKGLWVPFVLMAVVGGIVTWYYLAVMCKRIYKGYYYEGLLSMYGMMTGTISSGILLLRELDPDYSTPAADNLVIGSGFAIIFGLPMLIFISLAPKSALLTWITLALCAVYFVGLAAFMYKAGTGKAKDRRERIKVSSK